MRLDDLVDVRVEELRRRIEGLDRELQAWVKRCTDDLRLQANFSQITAVHVLVDEFIQQQRVSVQKIAAGATFAEDAYVLADDIARAQGVWDFFRDKLELRFNPDFQPRVAIADTVAWSCYMPVLERAVAAGLLEKDSLREPPLTYLGARLYARTFEKGSQPFEHGAYLLEESHSLPIPVIELPWDNLANLWELLAIPHEVAHDLEADLGLQQPLDEALAKALDAAGAPEERRAVWGTWRPEVYADLVAMQLAGPPFGEYLIHLLLVPQAEAITVTENDPSHPAPFVRILMASHYAKTLVGGGKAAAALAVDATALEAQWRAVYPATPNANPAAGLVDPLIGDIPVVAAALMDTGLPSLKGATVRSLMPYLPADDARLRSAAAKLAAGQVPPDKAPPRLCVSAARRAVAIIGAARKGEELGPALADLDRCAQRYVEANTPPGVRAITTRARGEYIQSFVERIRQTCVVLRPDPRRPVVRIP